MPYIERDQLRDYLWTSSNFTDDQKDDYITLEQFFEKKWSDYLIKALLMYGTAYAVLFPICILKNMDKMKFITFLAVFSFVYLVLVSI